MTLPVLLGLLTLNPRLHFIIATPYTSWDVHIILTIEFKIQRITLEELSEKFTYPIRLSEWLATIIFLATHNF